MGLSITTATRYNPEQAPHGACSGYDPARTIDKVNHSVALVVSNFRQSNHAGQSVEGTARLTCKTQSP